MAQQRRPVAVVTGGRQGLGRGCAFALAARGFDLVIVDRHDDDVARETLGQLASKGAGAHFVKADISDLDSLDGLAREAWGAFGAIDCLVNNAGVAPLRLSNVLTLTPEAFEHNIGINLRGNFFLAQAVGRLMQAAEAGPYYRSMMFITSIAANHVSVDIPEYCISKAGLSMVAGLFALTLAGSGIHVHEIRPGFIRTAMTASEGAPSEAIEAHIRNGDVPMNRWGEESDVGRTVATLAAGELPYLVGHPVYVDGGYGIATA
jgi:NAD(P)-dependent dehydrogenase (short-subunit alcohol dehydrogenase family)